MGFGGNVSGALHDFNLFIILENAHLVNDRTGIDNRPRRLERLPIRFPHQRELANDFLIHFGRGVTERVVESRRAIQNLGELFIELRQRKRFVGVVVAYCAVDPGAIAFPNFAFAIARTNEQRELLFF